MHLLFVTSLLPDEDPSTGFEIANRAIVEGYRENGVRLTIAGFARPGARPPKAGEILLGTIAIENAGAGRAQKARWLAKAVAEGLPVSAAKLRVLSRRALLDRLAAAGPVDGIVLNSVQMPAAYPFLTGLAPSIFIAHNVEHVSARQNAAASRSVVERLLYRREARLLEQAEMRLCREARIVHTLAAEDLGSLGLEGERRALALPLPVGRPAAGPTERRDFDVGLIGTWSWAPNRVGLDWFLAEVAPRLPADMRVGIAGRLAGPPPRAGANVFFLGRVPDAQAFVRSARVLALATKGGTGVQLKTIEALEEGMPCVATPSALRGVGRPLPGNVRLVDHAGAFAQELIGMVEAERTGAILRLDGRAFAQSQRRGLGEALRAGLALFAEARDVAGEDRTPRGMAMRGAADALETFR